MSEIYWMDNIGTPFTATSSHAMIENSSLVGNTFGTQDISVSFVLLFFL
jgi:hypothetical protein